MTHFNAYRPPSPSQLRHDASPLRIKSHVIFNSEKTIHPSAPRRAPRAPPPLARACQRALHELACLVRGAFYFPNHERPALVGRSQRPNEFSFPYLMSGGRERTRP